MKHNMGIGGAGLRRGQVSGFRNDEGTTEKDRRFLEVVMFVAGFRLSVMSRRNEQRGGPYANVPIPPASSRKAGPSCNVLPAQRMAKARRMWPWATIRTSPHWTSDLGFPMTGA